MSRAADRTRVRLATLALAAMGATSMAGCSEGDETPPGGDLDAINNGENVEIGAVSAENLLIVTSAENEPGRLLGRLITAAEEPVDVTFTDQDDEITVTLNREPYREDPGGEYSLEENPHLFDTTDAPPGALASITISVDGQTEDVNVPVFDGSLEYYRPFVPEG